MPEYRVPERDTSREFFQDGALHPQISRQLSCQALARPSCPAILPGSPARLPAPATGPGRHGAIIYLAERRAGCIA
jgi:hypothetical protein